MKKPKALVLNPAHQLCISLVINTAPLQPLLTHIRATYPDLINICPLTEPSPRIHPINRLPAAPHLIPIYKSLFESITKEQKTFGLVIESLRLRAKPNKSFLIAVKTWRHSEELAAWNQTVYDVLQKEMELLPRRRKLIDQNLKFKTGLRILGRMEKERAEEVLRDLSGRFGDKQGAMSVGVGVVGWSWPQGGRKISRSGERG